MPVGSVQSQEEASDYCAIRLERVYLTIRQAGTCIGLCIVQIERRRYSFGRQHIG